MEPSIAITREVSPALARCQLTHLPRSPIDVERARHQHQQYEQVLHEIGCTVCRLRAADNMPDSVFIEDVAVVLDDVVVITRPGAEARRLEVPAVEDALKVLRPVARIEAP